MGSPEQRASRKRIAAWAAFFAVGYGVAWAFVRTPLKVFLDMLFWKATFLSTAEAALQRIFSGLLDYLGPSFAFALFAASIVAPLVVVSRVLARARVRAGLADPLERARAWVLVHPKATRALTVAPTIAWAIGMTLWLKPWLFETWAPVLASVVAFVLPAALTGLGHVVLARAGLRALLAPTLVDVAEKQADAPSDDITFAAVAVTLETRAAVVGMAALPFVLFALVSTLAISSDTAAIGAMVAYVATAVSGVVLFRRASRIAVGLDGVLVTGTSRTRFYAYRELDDARVRGGDLEMLRGKRVVLRLQLHGDDARRREAILARVRESIARADQGKHDPTSDYVASASIAELARAADGAGDYRQAAVSREQLWAAVEGPGIDGVARRAAAGALARASDETERSRLRVAAERCAEPQVRVALQQLIEAVPVEEEHEEPLAEAFAKRSVVG